MADNSHLFPSLYQIIGAIGGNMEETYLINLLDTLDHASNNKQVTNDANNSLLPPRVIDNSTIEMLNDNVRDIIDNTIINVNSYDGVRVALARLENARLNNTASAFAYLVIQAYIGLVEEVSLDTLFENELNIVEVSKHLTDQLKVVADERQGNATLSQVINNDK